MRSSCPALLSPTDALSGPSVVRPPDDVEPVPPEVRPPPVAGRRADGVDLADLFHRIADGDDVAFGELYHRTRGRMDTIVRRTLRCPHQSDEVVQEIFLEVWQRANRYDATRGSVLGWMSMMAHRRAVDRVRLVVTAAVRDERDAARTDVDQGDVWDEVALRLDAQCVRAALAELSSLQREALSLTYLNGYSHRQAADLLAVPLSTFKTRIRDGMAVLRANLRPA